MKILITFASAGAGHRKAAESFYHYLAKHTSHDISFVDVLDHAGPTFKKTYSGGYSFLITHLPHVWGIIFAVMDRPWLQPMIRGLRRLYNTANVAKFHAYLKEEKFDYIFSTHFLPNEISATLKRNKKIGARIVSIITDYDVHRIWLADGIDVYAVACSFTKEKLKLLGVLERNIFISGIPSDEKFARGHDVAALKEKFGLKKDEFTVLIATGSFGIGPIEGIVDELKEFQVIVICGHNKKLYERLKAKARPKHLVCALVDNMDEMMALSDCMLTKPGGLSITEAMVSQLPLIFFSAIPGQETHNISVLKSYGIGKGPCSIREIVEELHALRSSKDAHRSAVSKLKELARPQAVKELGSLIV